MYSYIKPFIAIQRHTWIHNATDLQTAPWQEQTESATPARKAHAQLWGSLGLWGLGLWDGPGALCRSQINSESAWFSGMLDFLHGL